MCVCAKDSQCVCLFLRCVYDNTVATQHRVSLLTVERERVCERVRVSV